MHPIQSVFAPHAKCSKHRLQILYDHDQNKVVTEEKWINILHKIYLFIFIKDIIQVRVTVDQEHIPKPFTPDGTSVHCRSHIQTLVHTIIRTWE